MKILFSLLLLCATLTAAVYFAEPNTMTRSVSYQVKIDLPRAQCWDKLRDLSLAHHYVPGLKKTEITTDIKEGIGASRKVYQSALVLDETVEEWYEGKGFLIRLHRGENGKPPGFEKGWFRYQLEDAGGEQTLFTATMSYVMPWGWFGEALESLLLRRFLQGTVRDVALSMKEYYETGVPVKPERLKQIKRELG